MRMGDVYFVAREFTLPLLFVLLLVIVMQAVLNQNVGAVKCDAAGAAAAELRAFAEAVFERDSLEAVLSEVYTWAAFAERCETVGAPAMYIDQATTLEGVGLTWYEAAFAPGRYMLASEAGDVMVTPTAGRCAVRDGAYVDASAGCVARVGVWTDAAWEIAVVVGD